MPRETIHLDHAPNNKKNACTAHSYLKYLLFTFSLQLCVPVLYHKKKSLFSLWHERQKLFSDQNRDIWYISYCYLCPSFFALYIPEFKSALKMFNISVSLSLSQFPEMNAIAKEHQQSIKTNMVFFLIQNIGLLSGFSIIFLITMFAGDINLGWAFNSTTLCACP